MSLHRLVHSISQGGWQLVHQGKWRMELVSWVSLGHFHWIPWVTPSTSVLALMRAEFCSIWWILAYAYRVRFRCGKLSSYRTITDPNVIRHHDQYQWAMKMTIPRRIRGVQRQVILMRRLWVVCTGLCNPCYLNAVMWIQREVVVELSTWVFISCVYWYAMEERTILDWWESVAWWWGTVLMEPVKGMNSLVDGFVEIE